MAIIDRLMRVLGGKDMSDTPPAEKRAKDILEQEPPSDRDAAAALMRTREAMKRTEMPDEKLRFSDIAEMRLAQPLVWMNFVIHLIRQESLRVTDDLRQQMRDARASIEAQTLKDASLVKLRGQVLIDVRPYLDGTIAESDTHKDSEQKAA